MKVRWTTDSRVPGMPGILSAVLLVMLTAPTTTTAQGFRTESGRAEFTSSVPLHSFTGVSDRLVGRIDLATGEVDFYVDLETLETGIGKRDRDMRKTLNTADHPFAEFFGRLLTPFDPQSVTEQAVQVSGEFKIHGVSREITVSGTLRMAEDGLHLAAAWDLALADYDIEPPRLLIIKVDDIQKIQIAAVLQAEQ